MKAPAPGPLTACLVLTAFVAVFAALPASPFTAVLLPIFVGLLVVELDRSGRHVALRVVSLAAHLLPGRIRGDFETEWHDHVLSAGEAGMRPVLAAFSIAFRTAPRLALRYKGRPFAAKCIGGLLLAYFGPLESMMEMCFSPLGKWLNEREQSVKGLDSSDLPVAWTRVAQAMSYTVATGFGVISVANLPLCLIPRAHWARRPGWLLMTAGTLVWAGLLTLMLLAHSPVAPLAGAALTTQSALATLATLFVIRGRSEQIVAVLLWIGGEHQQGR